MVGSVGQFLHKVPIHPFGLLASGNLLLVFVEEIHAGRCQNELELFRKHIQSIHVFCVIQDALQGIEIVGVQRRHVTDKDALQLYIKRIAKSHFILQQAGNHRVLQGRFDVVDGELVADLLLHRTGRIDLIISQRLGSNIG